MLSKNKRNKIKKSLHELNSNKELVEVYDNLIKRYEDIKAEQDGVLEEWQQKELLSWKRIRLDLFKKTDSLVAGLNSLKNNNDNKLYDVIIKRYDDKKTITAVAYELKFSEERIKQILNEAYEKLNKFII